MKFIEITNRITNQKEIINIEYIARIYMAYHWSEFDNEGGDQNVIHISLANLSEKQNKIHTDDDDGIPIIESYEEIKDVFTIRDGNRVHIGFVVDQWESASYPISIWVGAKIVKNEQTSSS